MSVIYCRVGFLALLGGMLYKEGMNIFKSDGGGKGDAKDFNIYSFIKSFLIAGKAESSFNANHCA